MPGCLLMSAAAGRGGDRRGGLIACGHRGRDADIACDPHPQARALDLDFSEIGLVEQRREFADKRALVTGFDF